MSPCETGIFSPRGVYKRLKVLIQTPRTGKGILYRFQEYAVALFFPLEMLEAQAEE